MYPILLDEPEPCLNILILIQVYFYAQTKKRSPLLHQVINHLLTSGKYSTHLPSDWHLVQFHLLWPHFNQIIYQHRIQPQRLNLSLLSRAPPPSCTSALLKNTFATLNFFTKHIQPIISPKYITYKILHFGTPTNLQLNDSISSLSNQKHTIKNLIFYPNYIRPGCTSANAYTCRPATLSPKKITTTIIPYQNTSFILHNFHHKHPHPIFYQHLSPITPTQPTTH